MNITITSKDVDTLSKLTCKSFYKDQKERFELTDYSTVKPTENGTFHFYESQLTALLCFKYFAAEGTPARMLWDMTDQKYVVEFSG